MNDGQKGDVLVVIVFTLIVSSPLGIAYGYIENSIYVLAGSVGVISGVALFLLGKSKL